MIYYEAFKRAIITQSSMLSRIPQLGVILQTHAIAAALSEPQPDGRGTDLRVHPGKALISGCVSPKSAC